MHGSRLPILPPISAPNPKVSDFVLTPSNKPQRRRDVPRSDVAMIGTPFIRQPFVFKSGADDEETAFTFRSGRDSSQTDTKLPEGAHEGAEYETVAAEAAISRASTHYL